MKIDCWNKKLYACMYAPPYFSSKGADDPFFLPIISGGVK
jgi:hypothetical protein